MINDMNASELSDEQLATVAGGGSLIGNVGNPLTQIGINTNVQLNIGIAPTTAVVVGDGLKLSGANLNLGNTGLLGNNFNLK
jgi:hypothetical protein